MEWKRIGKALLFPHIAIMIILVSHCYRLSGMLDGVFGNGIGSCDSIVRTGVVHLDGVVLQNSSFDCMDQGIQGREQICAHDTEPKGMVINSKP